MNFRVRVCILAMAMDTAVCAFAAHPLQTEDTGTQGRGNVEIENGLSWTRTHNATIFVYQPQFSYGLTEALDLIVQPSWVRGSDARGFGDTNLDAKWRFFGEGSWSAGVRAGTTLATNQNGLGLPHGDASPHAAFIVTYEAAPFTAHANVGAAVFPTTEAQRRVVWRTSTAVMWAATDKLVWAGEVVANRDPDAARGTWPALVLGAMIYTVRTGLDVDLGYQVSSGARPSTHQFLMGLTYRFAP